MKLLRETIRRLIKESEEAEFLPKLTSMMQAGHSHFLQAKELASSLGLDIDLDLEFLKLIKQKLDLLLARVTTDEPMVADLYESDLYMQIYYKGYHPSEDESWGSIRIDDEGIKFYDEWYGDPVNTFDTIDALIAHLHGNLGPWLETPKK